MSERLIYVSDKSNYPCIFVFIIISAFSKRWDDAKRMEELCAKEMYDIQICDECFLRSNEGEFEGDNGNKNAEKDWFIEVCNPPHLLVWAKIAGYPFWPAKVISQISQNLVDVRFFGEHEMSQVEPSNCFLFSWENPNRSVAPKTKRKIERSLKV